MLGSDALPAASSSQIGPGVVGQPTDEVACGGARQRDGLQVEAMAESRGGRGGARGSSRRRGDWSRRCRAAPRWGWGRRYRAAPGVGGDHAGLVSEGAAPVLGRRGPRHAWLEPVNFRFM